MAPSIHQVRPYWLDVSWPWPFICILSFLPLAIRTFTLFESAALAVYPVRQFLYSLHTITSHGRHWLDPSFQNHARVISEQQLHLIENLFALPITDDRSSNDTILSIRATLHSLSRDYVSKKSRIPCDSLWFPQKSPFSPWQAASAHSQILLQMMQRSFLLKRVKKPLVDHRQNGNRTICQLSG